jgi:hypothetical protein
VEAAVAGLVGRRSADIYFDQSMIGGIDVGELPDRRRSQFASMGQLQALRRHNLIVVGHFNAQSMVAAGFQRLALQLREPRSRIMSLYRYWRSMPDADRAAWGRWGSQVIASAQLPFTEFLRSPQLWSATDNALARQLVVAAAPSDPSRLRGVIERNVHGDAYQRVRARLRIVEWSTASQRFLDRICIEHLGEAPVPVPLENVTYRSGDRQPITAGGRRRLEEMTRLDGELIARLVADGLLEPRSAHEMDREWEETAARLGFDLV